MVGDFGGFRLSQPKQFSLAGWPRPSYPLFIYFFFYSSLPSSADAAPGSPPAANKTRTSAVYKPPHCIFSWATSQQDAKHCTTTATKVDGSSTQATLEGPTGLPFHFFFFFLIFSSLYLEGGDVGLSNHYQVQVRCTWVEAQDEAQVHPAFEYPLPCGIQVTIVDYS